MKRCAALAVSVFLGLSALVGAGETTASFKSGDETVSGFLATPEGKGPFPAVVVIHEWWGLNAWTKDEAR
ncbi:MAG TPA: dienelactone hydrolase family protein, partial [Vicinamibacteria bacterium]|nr:dienelactone hydrolase family protein [Vicinamibacteria bacterium]